MDAALTKGHEDKHTGMQGCPGIGIAYTTHKNGQNDKLTGALRSQDDLEESGKAGGGSLKPSDLKMEKVFKKKWLSSKSSCDHSAPGSFPF